MRMSVVFQKSCCFFTLSNGAGVCPVCRFNLNLYSYRQPQNEACLTIRRMAAFGRREESRNNKSLELMKQLRSEGELSQF